MKARVVLGLGSSLGDRSRALRRAVAALRVAPGVRLLGCSRIYQTAPEGGARQGFHNAALLLETQRSPRGLLGELQALERRLGRRPSARWCDRALDIDILVWEGLQRQGEALHLPHRRLASRAFALVPAAEVAPRLRVPGLGRPLGDLPRPPGPQPVAIGLLGPRTGDLAGRGRRRYEGGPLAERAPMKFFLDTANLDEIRKACSWGIIDGVTTNPSLIAKEGRDFVATIAEICDIVKGPVSAETVSTDAEGMIREGKLLARISEHVVVKVPFCKEGMTATKALADAGIDVNVTLCFSAAHALVAAKAGAAYISPFVGRLDDIGHDGVALIEEIVQIYSNYPALGTQVLAASIRTPTHVINVAKAGSDVATIPFKVVDQLFHHPLTVSGSAAFLKDWSTVPDPDITGAVTRWLEKNGR